MNDITKKQQEIEEGERQHFSNKQDCKLYVTDMKMDIVNAVKYHNR